MRDAEFLKVVIRHQHCHFRHAPMVCLNPYADPCLDTHQYDIFRYAPMVPHDMCVRMWHVAPLAHVTMLHLDDIFTFEVITHVAPSAEYA